MITAVRGVQDILPESAVVWHHLEQTARAVFQQYGFREVRTPIFEKTELFARAVGETTDIVEKEMYTFPDRHGTSLSLRPEGTASIVRAYIEHSLERQLPWRVFYMGPMFRYERPQKGRFRQFHQIGCELFGPEGPLADAEIMAMAMRYFQQAGIRLSVSLEINSLGCPQCRPPYREQLIAYLMGLHENLCGDCGQRLLRNPLRVLDCKVEGCRALAALAPAQTDYLCPPCHDHFAGVRRHLEGLGLPYRHNRLLVRGLDYYTRTAFEVIAGDLGAQNAVAAGGRYNGLVAAMGGRRVAAIGFAMGLERLALLLDNSHVASSRPQVCIAAVGEQAASPALSLAEALRSVGLSVEVQAEGSLKNQMKKADQAGVAYTLILGEQELASGSVLIRDMTHGAQWLETLAQAVPTMVAKCQAL